MPPHHYEVWQWRHCRQFHHFSNFCSFQKKISVQMMRLRTALIKPIIFVKFASSILWNSPPTNLTRCLKNGSENSAATMIKQSLPQQQNFSSLFSFTFTFRRSLRNQLNFLLHLDFALRDNETNNWNANLLNKANKVRISINMIGTVENRRESAILTIISN